jgi:hypothetical protein
MKITVETTVAASTDDAWRAYPIEQQRGGWQAILDNFARDGEKSQ